MILTFERGKGNRSCYLYAHLTDDNDGGTVISADLNYVLRAIKERNYKVDNLIDAFIQLEQEWVKK